MPMTLTLRVWRQTGPEAPGEFKVSSAEHVLSQL